MGQRRFNRPYGTNLELERTLPPSDESLGYCRTTLRVELLAISHRSWTLLTAPPATDSARCRPRNTATRAQGQTMRHQDQINSSRSRPRPDSPRSEARRIRLQATTRGVSKPANVASDALAINDDTHQAMQKAANSHQTMKGRTSERRTSVGSHVARVKRKGRFAIQGMAVTTSANTSLLASSLFRANGKTNRNSAERSARSPAIALPLSKARLITERPML